MGEQPASLRRTRARQTWQQRLAERAREAARFEDRTPRPPVPPEEVAHRVVVLMVVVLITSLFVALFAAPGVGVFAGTVHQIASRFDEKVTLEELPHIARRSVIVDRHGRHIATLAGVENRMYVPLSRVPEITQDAVLAIEDARFYHHEGVDLNGLVRALLSNVRAGNLRQGGSTITQQLVKNTIVGTERSIDRKVREARLAVELEKRLTKRQILEMYLNDTYFGSGVYGIGTAAEYYFGRRVERLTLAESALLAGMIKAPETYDPIESPEAARRRRRLVLLRMADEGMITRAQAERAVRAPLGASKHPLPKPKVPHFVEYVKEQILSDRRFGETRAERATALFSAGLRIETTLDLKMMESARRSIESVLDRKSDPSSALVAIEPKTGAVRAMMGGRNFDKLKYNLATQGKRQPGSTFKVVTLVAALDAGFSPGLTLDTPSPLEIVNTDGKVYEVDNYSGSGHGFIDMRTATEQSVNTYYVQLMKLIGPQRVVEMGKKLGIKTPLQAFLSLTLGSVSVSPFELTSAYATIGGGGSYCRPYAIARVMDAAGRQVLRNKPKCEQRIDKGVAAQATAILRGVPLRGTGAANGRIGRPNAAKTGTTDDYTDAWYAGYTPQLATVVWIGYPDSTKKKLEGIHGLDRVTGGSLPAIIWSRFMRAAHRGVPVEQFPGPPAVPQKEVPAVVGKPVAEARATLERAGFSVRVEDVASARAKGTVVAQTPEGGTSTEAGRLVVLRVSTGKAQPDGDADPDGGTEGRKKRDKPRR